MVSTHSRLKAAGKIGTGQHAYCDVSTHSRLKAAGPDLKIPHEEIPVSTHSRLKAAGFGRVPGETSNHAGFNTQPPKGGWQWSVPAKSGGYTGFNTQPPKGGWLGIRLPLIPLVCFNTQPPKGGWFCSIRFILISGLFQHTAA